MLKVKRVSVIDHDWSLCVVNGKLSGVCFDNTYCIIHDDDAISAEFWKSAERICQCVINRHLGERLEAYYG